MHVGEVLGEQLHHLRRGGVLDGDPHGAILPTAMAPGDRLAGAGRRSVAWGLPPGPVAYEPERDGDADTSPSNGRLSTAAASQEWLVLDAATAARLLGISHWRASEQRAPRAGSLSQGRVLVGSER